MLWKVASMPSLELSVHISASAHLVSKVHVFGAQKLHLLPQRQDGCILGVHLHGLGFRVQGLGFRVWGMALGMQAHISPMHPYDSLQLWQHLFTWEGQGTAVRLGCLLRLRAGRSWLQARLASACQRVKGRMRWAGCERFQCRSKACHATQEDSGEDCRGARKLLADSFRV